MISIHWGGGSAHPSSLLSRVRTRANLSESRGAVFPQRKAPLIPSNPYGELAQLLCLRVKAEHCTLNFCLFEATSSAIVCFHFRDWYLFGLFLSNPSGPTFQTGQRNDYIDVRRVSEQGRYSGWNLHTQASSQNY